ncbi:23S rRNA methyltransferase [Colwellia sp. PAMC 20917]|uniref:RNA methyltransferase n=1 Tax=Colwellia sp. PAMC 20917 TaxID=1816218 RepID=UPI000879171E|nr:RNA methyltransferase [Colwellia sp. PAMC 20917]AOW78013.1 23S rRNA methyltransferase [Colwellia sp. PAMC 20917]
MTKKIKVPLKHKNAESAEITLGLTDPKSPSNVGAVMRAAGCYQVDSVLYSGVRYARAAKFHTDTQSASKKIPLIGVESLVESLPEGSKLICVDLIEGAVPLPAFIHPKNAMYVFGPEDGTISQAVIDKADAVVYIPTNGCMNLAATVNVLLYDRLAKSAIAIGDDELIRNSRDTNNTVKVKQ